MNLKPKPLPTKKAFELYALLKNHLPKQDKIDIDYVEYIINSIASSETEKDNYVSAVMLMYNIDLNKLATKYDSKEVLQLFMQGIVANRINELRKFMVQIGVKDA